MKTTYFVSADFEKQAREMRPGEDIRVDPRLLGTIWHAVTGNLPTKGLPPLPPGWVEEGKAIDGK